MRLVSLKVFLRRSELVPHKLFLDRGSSNSHSLGTSCSSSPSVASVAFELIGGMRYGIHQGPVPEDMHAYTVASVYRVLGCSVVPKSAPSV